MHRAAAVLAAALLFGAPLAYAADPELKTDDDKTLYAIGLALSRNLSQFNLTPAELDLIKAGLTDGVLNREKKVDFESFAPKIQSFAQARASAAAATEKKASQGFLDKAAAEKGAKKTASGLIYTEIKPGTGDQPKATDKVKVHYTGTTTDGKVFDSSVQRGQPAEFPLNGVIKCWTEGVQMMKVGGKSKLVCPSDLAYADHPPPASNIKPGAALIFDVELIEIVKAAPASPPAASSPPATPNR